jgi:putative ABC transport system ATP-binding protein
VILADEPTGALDSKTADEILSVLLDLHRGGATLVLVTHDREVAEVAERTIYIRDGQTHDRLA